MTSVSAGDTATVYGAQAAEVAFTADAQSPALSTCVVLHEPAEPSEPWVVYGGDERYFRVGADIVALLDALDPTRTIAEIAAILGPPWSAQKVTRTLRRLDALGLFAGAEDKPPRRRGRFIFHPPFTVQITLFDPSRLLGRIPRLTKALASRPGAIITTVLIVSGLLALAGQASSLHAAMLRPLTIPTFYAILGGIIGTTFVHEFGHGCVLVRYGGQPRRLGIMLFYLMPAFFCDVSDGWRLKRREERVAVALAGIATQWVIAAVTALIAPFVNAGNIRGALLVFAVVCYLYGLLNLLPFVKLDGYIALMSYLDMPHLRRKAVADTQRVLRSALAGSSERRELPGRWWVVPYGLCCLILPALMVFGALSTWFTMLNAQGRVGGVLCLALLAVVVVVLARATRRFIGGIRRAGFNRARLTATTLCLVVGLAAVLTLVKVPYNVQAGYAVIGGRAELVLPSGADSSAVTPGRTVTLQRLGIAMRQDIGTATVAGGGRDATVPFGAFVPVKAPGLTTKAVAYPLAGINPDLLPPLGSAVVNGGERSIAGWLVSRFLSPAVHATVG